MEMMLDVDNPHFDFLNKFPELWGSYVENNS